MENTQNRPFRHLPIGFLTNICDTLRQEIDELENSKDIMFIGQSLAYRKALLSVLSNEIEMQSNEIPKIMPTGYKIWQTIKDGNDNKTETQNANPFNSFDTDFLIKESKEIDGFHEADLISDKEKELYQLFNNQLKQELARRERQNHVSLDNVSFIEVIENLETINDGIKELTLQMQCYENIKSAALEYAKNKTDVNNFTGDFCSMDYANLTARTSNAELHLFQILKSDLEEIEETKTK